MPISFLHLDTLGTAYNTSPTNSTYTFVNNSRLYSPNAYNVSFKLQYPLYNTKRLFLKAFETALTFPNIRASSKLNTILVVCNGVTKTITLADKSYTDVATLITDLNTASTASYPSDAITFSRSTDFNITNIKITSPNFTSITVEYSNLAYILGFRPLIDYIYNNNAIASYTPNLAYDTYINLFISNINASHTPNNNGVNCSFKLPVTATSNTVQFQSENLSFAQFLTIVDSSKPVTNITIVIYDRWGYSLPSYGSDFTITFAIER
jgi:hypothetical protein